MHDLSLEDLATGAPFRDPEGRDLADVEDLLTAIQVYANAEPRILALSTPNHRVLFGVGAAVSFVDVFDWRTGQALAAHPNQRQLASIPTDFRGQTGSVQVGPEWLLSLPEATMIVEWIARHDERPKWIEWSLSP